MNSGDAFTKLVQVMDELREKCPWDKAQTIHTLRQMTLEETYELTDAITDENWNGIKEELGDLMLHLVFYAKIASEQSRFTLEDVIHGLLKKLIYRHPHIYGDVEVKNEEEVAQNWEKLKLKEGKQSILSGVPKALPALIKAMRLQEKAKQVGFEWETKEQVWEKVKEEMAELQQAVAEKSQSDAADELGDVLFSLINYARFLKIDAEDALARTNKKFIYRFTGMEKKASEQATSLDAMTLEEMDALWNQIKRQTD